MESQPQTTCSHKQVSANDFSIRVARKGDIDEMIRLLQYLFSHEDDFHFIPEHCHKGLEILIEDDNSRVLVAVRENRVIAMCSGQQNVSTAMGGKSLLVEDVVVNAQEQGMGIGTALLNNLAGWARNQGCKRMQLLADETNKKALDFYQRRHWGTTKLICLKTLL
ncbi:GNAT family N-acetyltransferase [Desulfopila sp. IMCC35008]|uniref:GNAT family N-acetyltransferase n=1 Tax=Desulfopila sp. IMCC35008 TaxID=2653858 RepID=UPI0013D1BDF8|nr:GNAT family N-acetyltransferase [Desulfopila sp. IMCC35008]